jgi:CTP synthase
MSGQETKYVIILGSLLSGIGKGMVTGSISRIFQMYGYNALPLKFDGYLNYDCGTMNPFRHGEVFVLDDGGEVDMDFGEYERMINRDLNSSFSLTGGKVFSEIIARERKGEFLGRDVQIIPHVTDFILEKVERVSKENNLDVMVIEVGGTVGDIENSYFIEAMRQLALKRNVVFVNITYVPELDPVGEQKTKPTQLAVRGLMEAGIQPDFIVCRTKRPLDAAAKKKIAYFANLSEEAVIDDHDLASTYGLPVSFIRQGFDKLLTEKLELKGVMDKESFNSWKRSADSVVANHPKTVNISIVGKYMELHDSYKSVKEALIHGAAANRVNLNINWIESEALENKKTSEIAEMLSTSHGILVPGGFGNRGIEGMINAINYARTKGVPYLGLCLGMQLMAVEFARNECGLKNSNSAEFDKGAENKIIVLLDAQKNITALGGTMRLGAWSAVLKEGTRSREAYEKETISERHRHRYEFNNEYGEMFEKKGMTISGTTTDGKLVEMMEWSKGGFGIATQAHPELKSRLEAPAPLFKAFIKEAAKLAGKD